MSDNTKRFLWLGAACICMFIVTGYTVEKALREGVTSYAHFATLLTFPALIGVLLHIAWEDLRSGSVRTFRAPVALVLAGLGLCVTLPASIGSSGGARDTAIATAERNNLSVTELTADLKAVNTSLKWAEPEMLNECKLEGPKCRSMRNTVKGMQSRKAELLAGMQTAPVVQSVTPGESRIVWAMAKANITTTEADVQATVSILPPIVAELFLPFFLSGGLNRKRTVAQRGTDSDQTSFPVTEPLPDPRIFSELPLPPRPRRVRKAKIENAIESVRKITMETGSPPRFSVVRGRHNLSKASASRALAEGVRLARVAA